MMKNYETVFILTPVLSEVQMKDAVDKFKNVLQETVGAEIIHEEHWGLRKLAYPIQHKSNGFYHLVEFKADPEKVNVLEVEYRRDEKIIRFLTTVLDKHAIDYNERRRKGLVGRKKEQQDPVQENGTTKKEVVTADKEK